MADGSSGGMDIAGAGTSRRIRPMVPVPDERDMVARGARTPKGHLRYPGQGQPPEVLGERDRAGESSGVFERRMMTPPQTEAELRQLIDRLADPDEMARWLEEILNQKKEDVCPSLENRNSPRPDKQGHLFEMRSD